MDHKIALPENISEDNDLLSWLSQSTEHRFEPVNHDATDSTEPLQSDFARPDENDFTKEEPAPEQEPPAGQEKPPEPPKPASFYINEAKVIVEAIDGYAKHFLPNLYRKKLFSEEEYREARQMIEKYMNTPGATKETFTPREKTLAERMERLDEMIKAIPTPPEGKQVIIEPLAEIMREHETTVSPMNRLLLAFAMVYGPKVLPAFL